MTPSTGCFVGLFLLRFSACPDVLLKSKQNNLKNEFSSSSQASQKVNRQRVMVDFLNDRKAEWLDKSAFLSKK